MDASVIIIGGGPVGLSLALGLAHHGVRSVVLERNADPAPESRALVVWTRTIEVLRDWDAWDSLRAAGRFSTDFGACNARTNRPLISIDFTKIDDLAQDPGVLFLPQDETERVLRELVRVNPACELRTGVEVTGIEQDGDGVDVRLRTESGEEAALRAPYAAGCDGAHGIARGALNLELEGMTYDARMLLTDEIVPGSEALCSPRMAIDRPGLLGAIQWAPGRWRILASLPKEAPDTAAYDDAEHAARLRKLFGEDVVTTTLWRSLFRIHRRHAQRFVVGRVALAGDAAHLNSPAGGQGMNAGIHDAANLAWKLAYALRGSGDAALLLQSYDVERREMIVDTVERLTDRMTRLGLGMPSSARQLALLAFGKAVRGKGIQRKLCRAFGMLSGRYAKSPLIDSRHPLAGRRIDDLLLPNGSRINHMRGGNAALVVVGNFDLGDDAAIRVARAPKRWCIKPPAVLIVRPDGVVAAVVEKPTRAKVESARRRAFALPAG